MLVGQILGFALLTWFVSTKLLPRVIVLLHRFLQVPQLSFGLLLGGLFLVVVGAEEVGLHGSLGALLFGSALSMLPYQVRRDIMPGMRSTAEGFFVPLFFASAGLHLSLDFLSLPPETILALQLVMFVYILLTPMGITFAVRRLKHVEAVPSQGPFPPSLDRFALEGIRVRDILDRSRSYPDRSLTVKTFADTWLLPEQHDYVVVEHGELAGIVSLSMLRNPPPAANGSAPAWAAWCARTRHMSTPTNWWRMRCSE